MNDRIERLQGILQQDPGDSSSRHALGLEYRAQGELSKALECFRETRDRDAGYLATYYQLGKVL
ncbi:MAG: hypothetical protein HY319_08090 [Armatimonadetes bacterium]|nr:hypothetical protein [Armatimonadota bacterium]